MTLKEILAWFNKRYTLEIGCNYEYRKALAIWHHYAIHYPDSSLEALPLRDLLRVWAVMYPYSAPMPREAEVRQDLWFKIWNDMRHGC